MKELKTPDLTPAALAAFAITMLTNAFVIFGLSISQAREAALEVLINGLFIVAFLAHDAIVRHGRSRALLMPPKGAVADDKPATRRTTVTRRTSR